MNPELYLKLLKLVVLEYAIMQHENCNIPEECILTMEQQAEELRIDIEGYEEFHTALLNFLTEMKRLYEKQNPNQET